MQVYLTKSGMIGLWCLEGRLVQNLHVILNNFAGQEGQGNGHYTDKQLFQSFAIANEKML